MSEMKKLNRDKVPMRNILGLIDNPKITDLLFEIVSFIDKEGRTDGVFNTKELTVKTRVRVSGDLSDDLATLVNEGYVIKAKASSKYQVISHPWEC